MFEPWYQLFASGNKLSSHFCFILLHHSSSSSEVASNLLIPFSSRPLIVAAIHSACTCVQLGPLLNAVGA
jgi:hypothetical protein